MPDFLTILTRWWKAIFGLTAIVAIVTAVILLFIPRYFVSTVTALPANGVTADKGSIFNTNNQELYPAIGMPDELDKVVGTASLDTLYIALVNQYHLVEHYDVKRGPHEVFKAVEKLRDNSSVLKSEYGEVKIRVWDEDAQLAANMANRYFELLQALHQRLQNEGNMAVLQGLQEKYKQLRLELIEGHVLRPQAPQNTDSSNEAILQSSKPLPNASLVQQYEQLIAEYSLLIESNPPVLLQVDRARPGYYIDRPQRWPIFCLTTFAAFCFGLLLAVLLEGRSKA